MAGETPEAERARWIAEGDALWAGLCALLDAMRAARRSTTHSPVWVTRDVYTHFLRMQTWSADAVRRTLAGIPLDLTDACEDEVNARYQREEAHRSLEDVRRLAHGDTGGVPVMLGLTGSSSGRPLADATRMTSSAVTTTATSSTAARRAADRTTRVVRRPPRAANDAHW